jgi:DNA-binding MarR family transcriptional regulator
LHAFEEHTSTYCHITSAERAVFIDLERQIRKHIDDTGDAWSHRERADDIEPATVSPGQARSMKSDVKKKPDVDLSAVNNRIFFRLFQLGNTLQRQAVKELGISTVQWAVLGALSRAQVEDGMSFAELSDYLVVSRQNLDGVLKRLERDDHVVRIADVNDKRARLVKLTPQGRRFWTALQPKIYEFYRQAMVQFRFDDSISFVHYLNRLQADLVKVKLPETK